MKKALKVVLVIVVILVLIVLFRPDDSPKKELGTLRWPSSQLSKMLPIPDSNIGDVTLESEDGLMIDVGDITEDMYNDYVEACKENGFTVDYTSGTGFYYANNIDGYDLSLYYDEDEEIMTINLLAPTEETTEESETDDTTVEEQQTENTQEESSVEAESESEDSEEPAEGIRPEFKEAMDSYEEFFNGYCDFMEEYTNSDDAVGMLNEYTEWMSDYTETMQKLTELGEEELSTEELQYYIEVTGRITQRLAEIGN